MKSKIIVILGPTAVGKTALGIDLAREFNGEIISGDSQQVYRQLDIGTAKASPKEQAAAVHHLIDVRDISENYSAYDFVKEAEAAIAEIIDRGKLPIVVGGTGLYLQSLIEGYHLGGRLDQEKLLSYRKKLESLSDNKLHALAADKSIEAVNSNRRRLIRHLELEAFGGNLVNQSVPYDYLVIGLNDDRDRLYGRINQRVEDMIAAGLLDEAEFLYNSYPTAQAAMGIGYKELFPYFEGQVSLEEAVEKIKQNSRRLAKRQLTWFRNRMKTDFYMISDTDYKKKINQAVRSFLQCPDTSDS